MGDQKSKGDFMLTTQNSKTSNSKQVIFDEDSSKEEFVCENYKLVRLSWNYILLDNNWLQAKPHDLLDRVVFLCCNSVSSETHFLRASSFSSASHPPDLPSGRRRMGSHPCMSLI